MKRIISLILIVIGFIVIFYPDIQNKQLDFKQKAIMASIEEAMIAIENDEQINNKVDLYEEKTVGNLYDEELNKELDKKIEKDIEKDLDIDIDKDIDKEIEKEHNLKEKKAVIIQSTLPVEATLRIQAIDLIMPIIQEAIPKHLNVSVCSINGLSKPWEHGNYVVAGHRSRTFGRHFNRLAELNIGDEIIVDDLDGNTYHYVVYRISTVHKTNLSVLDDEGYDELTLITCEPAGVKNPKYRLIIEAKKR
ncbi:MAG: class D sortase [Vallitalea sp.]|jgi:sortase A|nr:class D sortase [Vallitalea sp.]